MGMRHPNTIRVRREIKGWSRAHLAALAEIHPNYVERLEDGDSCPTIPVARRLAAALGCTVDDLFPLDLPSAANER